MEATTTEKRRERRVRIFTGIVGSRIRRLVKERLISERKVKLKIRKLED